MENDETMTPAEMPETEVPAEPENPETQKDISRDPLPDNFGLLCAQERAAAEYAEFTSLFPDMKLSELPDSVAESVRAGVPLTAACALYERRRAAELLEASKANEINSGLSFAVRQDVSQEGWLSPDEVRGMSPSEVRKNYRRILESMNHWH